MEEQGSRGGRREEGRDGGRRGRGKKGKGRYIPVTSYTFSSTMMYIPFEASLCEATSATVKVLDILEV